MDANRNRKWDSGDSFEDINQNGKKDFKEKYTDLNNNGKFDPSEKVNNFKFNYNAQVFAEDFIDASNGRYDLGERFEDLNEDGKWTDAESFEDLNGDGLWSLIEKEPVQVETVTIPEEPIVEPTDKPIVETPVETVTMPEEPEVEKIIISDYEPFTDQNGNNIWDAAEPFIDTGNGIYDIGEKFIDSNGNNKRDLILWYMDANRNRKWDSGDSFEDINQNGKKDFKEKYTDLNNNGKFDPSEKVNNFKFNYNAQVFAEDFIDASNGRYDLGERFEDLNEDGKWTDAESFEDLNGDGLWSLIEKEPVQVETVTIPEEPIVEPTDKPIVETPEPEPEVEKIITSEYEKFEVLDEDAVLNQLKEDSEMEVEILEIIPDPIIKVTVPNEETTIYEDVTDAWIPAKYYPLLPRLLNPFPRRTKTLSFKSNHPFWNGYTAGEVVKQVNATKKLNKIKQDDKAGLNLNTIVLYNRWEDKQHNEMVDLQIPAVISIDWYKAEALEENAETQFREKFIKHITKKSKNTNARGKGISIINTQIGDTDVELNINGNISVDGALVFENKDLVTTNLKESKSWDLEIEQTQRFNIDGNIGDRFFVTIKQDSEADFTWENDLTIEYKGDKNDILQKAEAGNINLSLEGMDAV
ncbi:uncharacterized protein METZ01_LOCUS112396, partial [marine metagenome]